MSKADELIEAFYNKEEYLREAADYYPAESGSRRTLLEIANLIAHFRDAVNEKPHEPIKDADMVESGHASERLSPPHAAANGRIRVGEFNCECPECGMHWSRWDDERHEAGCPNAPHAAAERTIPAGLKFGDTYQDTDGKVYGVGAGGGGRTDAAAEPEKQPDPCGRVLFQWVEDLDGVVLSGHRPASHSPSAQPIAREPTELTDDMLRYAMAAMGTGKWEDAERFRQFWKFATEAALKSAGKEST